MTAALERSEWSAARPGRTLPPGRNRYRFYRRLVGPQDRSENLVTTGIRSRTVQPVAQSLYRLSYPAHIYMCVYIYIYIYIYINFLKIDSAFYLDCVRAGVKTRFLSTIHHGKYTAVSRATGCLRATG